MQTRVNPTEFQGYPVELLRGLAGMGPALIDNDALFQAATAYNSQAAESGIGNLGPALLTKDPTQVITSATVHSVPADVGQPFVGSLKNDEADELEIDPWAKYDLDRLLDLVATHGVTIEGRVKTPGKLIAALTAAGVVP